MTRVILILALVSRVFAASYNYYGCFASSSVGSLTSRGTYQFQSTSYCREDCGDTTIAAMSGGNACFCGSSVPSSSDKVDESFCDEPCDGYPLEICGGTNYLSVYVNEEADLDDESTSSSSATSSSSSSSSTRSTSSSSSSSSSSTSSSTSSSSSSTNSPSPTSSASSSTTSSSTTSSESSSSSSLSSTSQQVSVIIVTTSATGSGTAQVVTVTTALDSSQETGSSNSSSSTVNRGDGSSSSMSKGAIAGTVIGSVIGGILLIVALAFWWWRRRSDIESDIEADNEKKEAAVSDFVRSYAVPPAHIDSNSPLQDNDQVSLRPNNVLTRRFSHGSLPDVTQESYDPSPGMGGLRIINPDNPTDDEV